MLTAIVVIGVSLLLFGFQVYRTIRRERKSAAARAAALAGGLAEPASLHPVIDPELCIGCAACVEACPELDVLGMVDGKAQLINPSHCIGHGACRTACPTKSIALVFGTERRGVDIPLVSPTFETNVPGIFIAGELGGMGLIRNAIEQGRQAIESVRKAPGIGTGDRLDVLIVGAGPAGFSASLAAKQHGLRFVTVEQNDLGGTVAHFPRGKIVMTAPVDLPLIGKVRIKETTKEALLKFWQDAEQRTGVRINYEERMEAVTRNDDGFTVRTTRGVYETRSVLLAVGRRGTPRKLEVEGEELPKVVYRLVDPEQYRGLAVLVVGGGDSALEAATSIADVPGATVALSYRGDAFSRAKEKNRERLQVAVAAGRLQLILNSTVKSISAKHVRLEQSGETVDLPNDAVIVCLGGVLPTAILKEMGIEVETKFGAA